MSILSVMSVNVCKGCVQVSTNYDPFPFLFNCLTVLMKSYLKLLSFIMKSIQRFTCTWHINSN